MADNSNYRLPFAKRFPILANLLVIILIAIAGIVILYLSIAIFTKHGQSDTVPGVEHMSYTQAVEMLHDHGFKVDIRDSLYKDDVKPGFVIEQYPKAGSVVKPGRKIFLYINAVHPKEVVVDDDNHPMEDALRGFSYRSAMAKLEELGFKNIRVVKVLGDNDCVAKLTANGNTVKKMQKVPVNARIVLEVYDNRLEALRDSLYDEEYLQSVREQRREETPYDYNGPVHVVPDNAPGTTPNGGNAQEEEDDDLYF